MEFTNVNAIMEYVKNNLTELCPNTPNEGEQNPVEKLEVVDVIYVSDLGPDIIARLSKELRAALTSDGMIVRVNDGRMFLLNGPITPKSDNCDRDEYSQEFKRTKTDNEEVSRLADQMLKVMRSMRGGDGTWRTN